MGNKRSISSLLLVAGLGVCVGSERLAAQSPAALSEARQKAEEADRMQISAATDDAASCLRDKVLREEITPGVTLGDVLRKANSSDRLDTLLRGGDLVGGPRWMDRNTCQVQLEVTGAKLAQFLDDVIAAHPSALSIMPASLKALEADWRKRRFSATGTSTTGVKAVATGSHLRDLPPAWQALPEADRQRALDEGRRDAVQHILDSIRPVPIPLARRDNAARKTVGNALDVPSIEKAVRGWLDERPIVRVRYRDDLRAEVTLGVQPSELYTFVDGLLGDSPEFAPAAAERAAFRAAFVEKVGAPFGRSDAAAGPGAELHVGAHAPPVGTPPPPRLELPDRAPPWINDRMVVDVSVAGRPRVALLATRALAVGDARTEMRARIGKLKLTAGTSIADAAQHYDRVDHVIGTAALNARVERAEYRADGGVSIRLTLDLRIVWEDLRDARPPR